MSGSVRDAAVTTRNEYSSKTHCLNLRCVGCVQLFSDVGVENWSARVLLVSSTQYLNFRNI